MLETVLLLTLTVYHEARGEGEEGQRAVVHVVLNRAASRGKTIEEIVLEPNQFSCYNDGVRLPDDPSTYLKILYKIPTYISGEDNTGGAIYYHSVTVSPDWSKRVKKTGRIGNHIFYGE